MKLLVWVLVIGAVGYFGYMEWQKRQGSTPDSTESTASSASSDSPAPAPSATPAPVALSSPTPHEPRLAPAGTYFLLKHVSVTTDSGVIGAPPGTRVKLVHPVPTGLRVSDGTHEFDVSAFQVTNDLDAAQHAIDGDRATQARLIGGVPPGTTAAPATAPAATPAPANGLFPVHSSGSTGSTLDTKPFDKVTRK